MSTTKISVRVANETLAGLAVHADLKKITKAAALNLALADWLRGNPVPERDGK